MAKLLDGKNIAQALKVELIARIKKLKRLPKLSIVQVGLDPASTVYVKNLQKKAEEIGIDIEIHHLNEISEIGLINFISTEVKDDDAVIIQLPLPKSFNTQKVLSSIRPDQDVDGLHYINVGRRRLGYKDEFSFWPCTPLACIEILDRYNINIEGKHVVIVGRSNLVGRPLATFLEHRNATVTQCHSYSRPLSSYTVLGDILVVAIGKARIITAEMVKKDAIVIDVGMNRDENGKLCGDVDFKDVKEKCSYITPVPGGVGPITVMELFSNTVLASERNQKVECE
ncbi:MAG: bifunctional 5,10-methylenetetrahydrofolate dehydrogenase/5,10-methenyltetrahydrofolate cyclohydrolase [Candidatus Thorarchaeota archaeon]